MGSHGIGMQLANEQTTVDLELLTPGNIDGTVPDDSLQIPVNAVEREYVCPNGGYGWKCVLLIFMMQANTWGINFVSDKPLAVARTAVLDALLIRSILVRRLIPVRHMVYSLIIIKRRICIPPPLFLTMP